MKNKVYTFAEVSRPKKQNFTSSKMEFLCPFDFLYLQRYKAVQIPRLPSTTNVNGFFGRKNWEANSLFCIITLIFHRQMTKEMKNQSSAKHSTTTLTPTGAKSVCPTNELIPVELIQISSQLKDISLWFDNYKKQATEIEDCIDDDLRKIQDFTTAIIYHIGEIVACEFRNNTYYKFT